MAVLNGVILFVASLGLLGLVTFSVERRTKEIGVRKVLGATISEITILLSREFAKWVAIAALIAWPLAFYAMNRWLQGFAYRTGISIGVFILSSLLALLIAVLTVSFQAIRAARANPVESLRYE
jgi:putative ABC transport system permease protein